MGPPESLDPHYQYPLLVGGDQLEFFYVDCICILAVGSGHTDEGAVEETAVRSSKGSSPSHVWDWSSHLTPDPRKSVTYTSGV